MAAGGEVSGYVASELRSGAGGESVHFLLFNSVQESSPWVGTSCIQDGADGSPQ